MIVNFIQGAVKTSIIFIFGVVYGIITSSSGLTSLADKEVYSVPLTLPLVIAPLLVLFFIILWFRKDKIEQMKEVAR